MSSHKKKQIKNKRKKSKRRASRRRPRRQTSSSSSEFSSSSSSSNAPATNTSTCTAGSSSSHPYTDSSCDDCPVKVKQERGVPEPTVSTLNTVRIVEHPQERSTSATTKKAKKEEKDIKKEDIVKRRPIKQEPGLENKRNRSKSPQQKRSRKRNHRSDTRSSSSSLTPRPHKVYKYRAYCQPSETPTADGASGGEGGGGLSDVDDRRPQRFHSRKRLPAYDKDDRKSIQGQHENLREDRNESLCGQDIRDHFCELLQRTKRKSNSKKVKGRWFCLINLCGPPVNQPICSSYLPQPIASRLFGMPCSNKTFLGSNATTEADVWPGCSKISPTVSGLDSLRIDWLTSAVESNKIIWKIFTHHMLCVICWKPSRLWSNVSGHSFRTRTITTIGPLLSSLSLPHWSVAVCNRWLQIRTEFTWSTRASKFWAEWNLIPTWDQSIEIDVSWNCLRRPWPCRRRRSSIHCPHLWMNRWMC